MLEVANPITALPVWLLVLFVALVVAVVLLLALGIVDAIRTDNARQAGLDRAYTEAKRRSHERPA